MSDLPFTIRSASSADYDALCAVWEVGDALHRGALPWVFGGAVATPRDRKAAEALMTAPSSAVLLVESEGEILGAITVLERSVAQTSIKIARRYVEIDNLAVKTEAQRRGIGRALVKAAEQWAAERGISTVELNVYAFNEPAASLYRTLGYSTIMHRMMRKTAT